MAKITAIERTINTIKTRWRDGKTLKEIAGRHRVDAGNLERAFHRREGVTIKQFIDQQRRAYLLSRLVDLKLYGHEIGTQMGFPSKRAFYRWVRRAFGISFTTLRVQARDNAATKRDDKK